MVLLLSLLVYFCGIFGCDSKQLQDFEPRGKSLNLTPLLHSDELKYILNEKKTFNYFIYFYAPWCKECKDVLGDIWNKLAAEFDYYGGIRVISIDCTGTGERACLEHNVLSYPYIIEISQSNKENSIKKTEPYWGHRSLFDLRKWIISKSTISLGLSSTDMTMIGSDEVLLKETMLKRSFHRRPIINETTGKTTCHKWRASEDCDPEGKHKPSGDLHCNQPVLGNRAGYCECEEVLSDDDEPQYVRKKLVDCGHEHRKSFTCLDVCKPMIGCEGWKATKNCFGGYSNDFQKLIQNKSPKSQVIRDNSNDQDCRKIISLDWSGFCDCGNKIEIPMNCSSSSFDLFFTCEKKCDEKRLKIKISEENDLLIKKEKRLKRISEMKLIKPLTIEEEEKINLEKIKFKQYSKDYEMKLNEETKRNDEKIRIESELMVQKEIDRLNHDFLEHAKQMKVGPLLTVEEMEDI